MKNQIKFQQRNQYQMKKSCDKTYYIEGWNKWEKIKLKILLERY